MYIASTEVLGLIPARPVGRPDVVLAVRHRDNGLAFTVGPHEAQVLASMGWVEGFIYKGKLVWLRLLVHASKAMKLLFSPLQSQTAKGVTARKQSNGAKHWVTRLDRAECGVGGGSSRVVFPLAFSRTQGTERREVA